VRAALEEEPDTVRLHRRLAALDPVAAGRMEQGNRRRVVRALEVTLGSGRPFSSFGPGLPATRAAGVSDARGDGPAVAGARIAGVWLPRDVNGLRIDRRLAAMVEAGLVAEVEALAGREGGLGRTARQALGYREVLGHIEDGVPLDAALDEVGRRTRRFARRQRMWFRRDPRITWHGTASNPLAVLPVLLGDWARWRS
jgi:tRNA dimethylallyltransferase